MDRPPVPPQPLADFKENLGLTLAGLAALAELIVATRPYRGSRCSPLIVRMLAPLVWFVLSQAGGNFGLFLVVCGFLTLMSWAKRGERLAARKGLVVHSRNVGAPLHCGTRAPAFLDYALEVILCWGVAFAFLLFEQTGLALCFFLGSLATLAEHAAVGRKDRTMDVDSQDALIEAQHAARRRGGW